MDRLESRLEGVLSERESLKQYVEENIYKVTVGDALPQDGPVAMIIGGQNASGKSSLSRQFVKAFEITGSGIVVIEGDALRRHHPKFQEYNTQDDKMMAVYTAKDAGRWTNRLIDDVSQEKYNLLLETTLRNPQTVTDTVERLSCAGYDIQIKAFVVSYDKSLVGSYHRYECMKAESGAGRFVHDNALKAAYNGMPETLRALQIQNKCSSIHLYTREGVLFNGDYRQADIVRMVRQERIREYRPDEIKKLKDDWREVGSMMLKRNAGHKEYIEISARMKERIKTMSVEGAPGKNIETMCDIYRNFNNQISRDQNRGMKI